MHQYRPARLASWWALFIPLVPLVLMMAALMACSVPSELTALPFLATETPTPTPTSTPTPTPTPTSTPTPTPTPDPAELLSEAGQALHQGDHGSAAETYRRLLALPLGDERAPQAQLGLGTALLRDGEYAAAADAFQSLLAAYPQSEEGHDAHFLLAEALVGAGQPLSATEEYRAYLAAGSVITAYVSEWMGDAHYAGEDHPSAVEAYRAAVDSAPDRSSEVGAREKLARAYVALEDYAAAVAQYDAILDVAQIRTYRARIEYQAAETLLLAGESEAGYERHRTVVETYYGDYSPYAEYYPYLSLVELVEAGRPVDDFLRGLVDYYGGAYGPAVEALYRYINAYPETHSGDAHWYAGLSFAEAGSPDLAINEFRLLIETHPENERVGDAWMALAEVYADQDQVAESVQTYREFVAGAPDHGRAPEALWQVARLLERAGDLEAAAQAYLDCNVEYPDSDYAAVALFHSGLQSYRTDDLVGAAVAWDTLANIYPDSPHRPVALLWLGKLRRAQGDDEAAGSALGEAEDVDPVDYYGLRAADLLTGPDASIFPVTRYAPDYDAVAEQAAAEAWLAGWLGLEEGEAVNLSRLAPTLAADPRLQRGRELWRLGRFEEARWELEALRRATDSDALAQYQLALELREVGLYRSSILCAARVVHLSPVTRTLDAPAFVGRLVYPTYYEDLVLENARRTGLDPLLIFSLIRQESLFESLATSTASAHGLMQVIPPTGAQIAAELGWPPDYETGDLYLPYVSLRFGTYYLEQQRERFEGRIDAALAGYNGGPFNAQRWLERAGDDPDLFVELISFGETRSYVRRIREHLAHYRALYGD